MNYAFQIVPADDLTLYHKLLNGIEAPVDRHQALKLGACAVLVASLSEQCVAGIAEEKRQLAVWVRNQRSVVRVVRFKGSSKYRGALNADISNASDRARNQLDQLRSFAPEARRQAEQRFKQAEPFVSVTEATAYVPTYQAEVTKRKSAEESKGFAVIALIAGVIFLFAWAPLGAILLFIALVIWLANKDKWQSIKEAEVARSRQLSEIKQVRAVAEQFQAELDPNPVPQVDETVKPSIAAIAKDLEKQYVFLDVACRDLNSQALSWELLAKEVIDAMTDPAPVTTSHRAPKPPPPPPLSVSSSQEGNPKDASGSAGPTNAEHSVAIQIQYEKDVDDYYFRPDLEQIRLIMRHLGYKRMPKDTNALSIKAEERVGRFLADQAGISYDDYFWSYEEGEFKAELLA